METVPREEKRPKAADKVGSTGKYETTLEKLKETLGTYGVAVFPGLLDEKECSKMVEGMWEYLEAVSQKFSTPINRKDKRTWRYMKELFPLHSMLLKQFGIGQTQMSWDLRQNPKVSQPFATLWSTRPEDLLCSFDGASFLMPPEVTNVGWSTGNYWWHTDQSYLRNEFECVQSWVSAYDTNAGDATLAVMEGSHKLHGAFAKKFGIVDKSDWFKLQDEHVAWYKKQGCLPVHITCPAGSMVFWDSRTIHCGTNAQRGRSRPTLRCVAYICMTPRKRATEAELKKRQKAFEDGRTTSHWPSPLKMNPTTPRTYGTPLQTITQIPKPKLNNLGYRLVGYPSKPPIQTLLT